MNSDKTIEFRGSRILVIEDEAQIRTNLAQLLNVNGFAVQTAANGQEGIRQALVWKPDLVLCDIVMPVVDGYQVLEVLRQHRSLGSVPFIFLTAKADGSDLRRGMVLGADDYLTKPFTMADLIAAILSRLERKQQWLAQEEPLTDYLSSIQGCNSRGNMMLRLEDCLYFYTHKRVYYLWHTLGTFKINQNFDELINRLNPAHFFRVNRKEIIHRNALQQYAYWQQGKYCLWLGLGQQMHEVILPRARYKSFLEWLQGND